MAIRRFSTSNLSGGKSSKLWDQETTPGYFESIATVIVPSAGTATVTFSNIPNNYAHLQIRVLARTATGSTGQDDLTVIFNSDSTNNYWWHRLLGNGTSASSSSASALTSGNQLQELIARDGQGASVYSGAVIDILDYANTSKYKVMRCIGGDDTNGNGVIGLTSASWNSTSAITSIALSSSANFKQFSHFALYGIRGA